MKKKVLFINTPAYDRSKAFFPPDIAYLVSAFEKEEIECDVFDANFDSDKIMDIRMLSALYMHRIILFVFLPIVIRFHILIIMPFPICLESLSKLKRLRMCLF